MLTTTPLPWASVSDLPAALQTDPGAQDALDFASFVLWSMSGRMYEPVQTTTEAYDARTTLAAGAQVYPVFIGGTPYNVSGCADCACAVCGVFHRTRLRGYPVQHINKVWVNGVLLAPTAYVLLDYAVLGLKTATACGAQCLTVEYVFGAGVPPGGKNAAVKLASELILSGQGAPCSLPERVTSVTRQGMSYTLLDPQDFLEHGRTGIYEIDLMLKAVNPAGALKRPRVFSPDIRRAEVQVYAAAAPYVELVSPNDQVVVMGSDTRWVSYDPQMVAAVRTGSALTTELSDGSLINTRWRLQEAAYGDAYATLDLEAYDARRLRPGMIYTVRDSTGMAVLHGEVQTL